MRLCIYRYICVCASVCARVRQRERETINKKPTIQCRLTRPGRGGSVQAGSRQGSCVSSVFANPGRVSAWMQGEKNRQQTQEGECTAESSSRTIHGAWVAGGAHKPWRITIRSRQGAIHTSMLFLVCSSRFVYLVTRLAALLMSRLRASRSRSVVLVLFGSDLHAGGLRRMLGSRQAHTFSIRFHTRPATDLSALRSSSCSRSACASLRSSSSASCRSLLRVIFTVSYARCV
jgi:hypothetical protein